jgi:hypothetical protein
MMSNTDPIKTTRGEIRCSRRVNSSVPVSYKTPVALTDKSDNNLVGDEGEKKSVLEVIDILAFVSKFKFYVYNNISLSC